MFNWVKNLRDPSWMMDQFGNTDPKKMPSWHFSGALNLDFATAVRADITKQDYSVCPRFWYLDMTLTCEGCECAFEYSASEQRFWYEELRFFVDVMPRRCPACRKKDRRLKLLKQQYDALIESAVKSKELSEKIKMLSILDELSAPASHRRNRKMSQWANRLPEAMIQRRELLLKQIRKLQSRSKT